MLKEFWELCDGYVGCWLNILHFNCLSILHFLFGLTLYAVCAHLMTIHTC